MRKIAILLAVLILSTLFGAVFRDILFLKNGEEVRCNILEIRKNKIIVETEKGKQTFKRGDVVRLTMTHPRPGDEWKTISDIKDSVLLTALSKQELAKKYPGASYVILNQTIKYEFTSDTTARKTVRNIILILTERGKGVNATKKFYFVKPYQDGDIDFCRTITADSNVYHLDDAAFELAEMFNRYPSYNLLRRIKVAPPQISVGAVVDYQYHIDYNSVTPAHPLADRIVFGGEEPILHKEVIAEIPANLPKDFVRYYGLSPEETEKNGRRIYKWAKDDIAPVVHEVWSAPYPMFLPTLWIGFNIDEAKLIKVLADSFAVSMDGSQKLDAFVDSITQNLSPKQKFYKIYEYLNITFRKVSAGMSQYKWFPRKVSEIFDDGIANPLDLAALMTYMLNHAGIESQLIYATDVLNGRAIDDVPSLAFFSTPLVAAKIDGNWMISDPFSKYLPPGNIPPDNEGQMGIWLSESGAQMMKLPENDQWTYGTVETLWIDLSPTGDADTRIKTVYGDYESKSVRYYREQQKKQIDRDFETGAGDFYPGAKLVDYSITGINSLDSTAVVSRHLSVPQLAQSAGKKLLAFQFPDLEFKPSAYGQPQRQTPIWFNPPVLAERVWIVKLPEKFEPQYIPQDFSFSIDSIKYSLSFKYDKTRHAVIATEHKEFADRLFPAEDYPQLRAAMFRRSQATKSWVILKK